MRKAVRLDDSAAVADGCEGAIGQVTDSVKIHEGGAIPATPMRQVRRGNDDSPVADDGPNAIRVGNVAKIVTILVVTGKNLGPGRTVGGCKRESIVAYSHEPALGEHNRTHVDGSEMQ